MSAIIAASIPAELRARRQWVMWRLETVEGRSKPTKVPYTTRGSKASTTNPTSWATFEECQQVAAQGDYTGVGFVFSKDDPYVGLDFDNMDWAQVQPLVAALLPAYVEVSQSGLGIHVICKGALPAGQRRKGSIECYSDGRFFALTGNSPDGDLPVGTLADRTAALVAFHTLHLGGFVEPERTAVTPPLSPDDQQVLDRIAATKAGRLLHRLFFVGETVEHKRSEADYDLAAMLCDATADDEQVTRLMWASALKREKWTQHRTLVGITVRNVRRAHPGPLGISLDQEPLDVTAQELATNPDLLKVPASLSPWLVWRGEYSILVGREKLAGKSTLAGSDAAGALKAGLTVLWVTAEESLNRVVKRFTDLQAPLANLILLRRWPQSWEEVEDVIRRRQPDAIYVDSQSSFLYAVDGEVPQTSELEKWQAKGLRFKSWSQLVPAHSAGVCVLVHAKKSDGNYAGSVGIGAAADTLVTMREVDKAPTARRLELKGRWGFPSQVVRYVDDVQGYVAAPNLDAEPVPVQAMPKGQLKQMLDALTPGMLYSEWEKAYGGNPNTFKSYVGRLGKRGLVQQDPVTGTWAPAQFTVEQDLAA